MVCLIIMLIIIGAIVLMGWGLVKVIEEDACSFADCWEEWENDNGKGD